MKTTNEILTNLDGLKELSNFECITIDGGDAFMYDLGKFLGRAFGAWTSIEGPCNPLTFGKI